MGQAGAPDKRSCGLDHARADNSLDASPGVLHITALPRRRTFRRGVVANGRGRAVAFANQKSSVTWATPLTPQQGSSLTVPSPELQLW